MKKTPFANLAASKYSTSKRALYDYYATDERCVMDLMEREELTYEIVEPSVGAGHIANCLAREHCVVGIDIVDADIPYSHPVLFLWPVNIDAQVESVIGGKLEIITFCIIV